MVGEEGKEIRESYVGWWWCGGKDRSYSRISGLQYIDPEINEPSVFFCKTITNELKKNLKKILMFLKLNCRIKVK